MRVGYFSFLYAGDLSHNAVAVYMYLHDRAGKNGSCYPAIGTIARDLKLSRSTVKRGLAELLRRGFITKEQRWRENGGRSSCLYRLCRPPP